MLFLGLMFIFALLLAQARLRENKKESDKSPELP